MNKKKILGILNLIKHSKLGELLLFIENLKVTSALEDSEIDIMIITENKEKTSSFQLPILNNYLEINDCHLFSSYEEMEENIQKSNYDYIFPEEEDSKVFDNTEFLREFHVKNGYIPYLESKKELKESSEKFLKTSSIIVHLKNSSNQINESNANLSEWKKFFEYCNVKMPDKTFYLIGSDDIGTEIPQLPNVIKTNNLSLLQELSLIEAGHMFMGMCSGPFQIALCNKNPYIVFKNKDHHREEMIKEIGDENSFSFSSKNQFIVRDDDSFENLRKYFEQNEI